MTGSTKLSQLSTSLFFVSFARSRGEAKASDLECKCHLIFFICLVVCDIFPNIFGVGAPRRLRCVSNPVWPMAAGAVLGLAVVQVPSRSYPASCHRLSPLCLC